MTVINFKDEKASRSGDPADWEVLGGLKHIVGRLERGEFKTSKAILVVVLETEDKKMMATVAIGMGVGDYIESLGILSSASLDVGMAGACAPNEPELSKPLEIQLEQ